MKIIGIQKTLLEELWKWNRQGAKSINVVPSLKKTIISLKSKNLVDAEQDPSYNDYEITVWLTEEGKKYCYENL